MSSRLIAIDWSGAQQSSRRKIWLAEAVDGRLVRLENGRDRGEIAEHLIGEAARGPEFIVGLDFAFSLPAWFLRERGYADAPALWQAVEQEGEAWHAACAPPFWGRPGRRRAAGDPATPATRVTERTVPSQRGIRPKSVFQIGGAGAVGTGSLRGMRLLQQLRDAGFSIWPFDPPGWPRVVEIYPRLLTGPVVKTNGAAREAYLATTFLDLDPRLRERAASSDDAFDAAVSALVMAQHHADLATLPAQDDADARLEGMIWWPGWRTPGAEPASPH